MSGIPLLTLEVPFSMCSMNEAVGDFEIDGEHFRVTGAAGRYHYLWRNGPNNYGFSSSSSVAVVTTREEHMTAIRQFLAEIDPETSFMFDD